MKGNGDDLLFVDHADAVGPSSERGRVSKAIDRVRDPVVMTDGREQTYGTNAQHRRSRGSEILSARQLPQN